MSRILSSLMLNITSIACYFAALNYGILKDPQQPLLCVLYIIAGVLAAILDTVRDLKVQEINIFTKETNLGDNARFTPHA